MRVLIADDDPVPRRMLQAILKKWDYEVVEARNGAEAWEILQSEQAPSIAILDWLMPELDGVEVCRRMRQRTDAPYVYFILLTSKDRKQDIIEGMEAGADDYLTKPFETHRLQVRLRAGRRILDLQAALMASVEALAEARRREVEIGARIQQTLLLGQPPAFPAGLEAAALTIPSQQIDGDFYDFFEHPAQGLDVIVGDVMGKGVPAALFGAAVKSQFMRALGRFVCSQGGRIPEPEQIVSDVHSEVTSQFIGLESYMTLCYARFIPARHLVTFVDCGHTKTIHCSARTGEVTTLEGDGLPLGVSEREVYHQVSADFEEGDTFCFYSDGVTEARNPAGEMFGFERLASVVRGSGALAAAQLVERVKQSVVEFSSGTEFGDDLTCVVIRISALAGKSGAPVAEPLSEDEPQQSTAPHDRPEQWHRDDLQAVRSGNADVAPMSQERLQVASRLSELQRIRSFVRAVCLSADAPRLPEARLHELELAVNEAASNIIRHAYDGRESETIRLQAEAHADHVEIRLYNSGRPFDPRQAKPPAFDGTRDGGFGVYMIENSVDQATYYRDDDGWNVLQLIKRYGSADAAPGEAQREGESSAPGQ